MMANKYTAITHGLTLVLTCLLLSACIKVGPDYVAPQVDLPSNWPQQKSPRLDTKDAHLVSWWRLLKDPQLDSLIERAKLDNLTLKELYARIKEARAIRGIAAGEYYPQIDGIGSAERRRFSEDFLLVTTAGKRTDNFYRLGAQVNWELDFWGRIARAIESTDANLDASIENFRDGMVILFSDVAVTYVEIRTLQARIYYIKNNIAIQRESLKITKARYKAEISPELDVKQAELNLARTLSVLPNLEKRLRISMNQLSVLLGEQPQKLHAELKYRKSIPNVIKKVAVGIPISIMRQRPDIRRAERELAAQTALIGVAKSDLYPRFRLFGSFALAGTTNIFNAANRSWAFGPNFTWNIFSGGIVQSNIQAEKARTEQALQRYKQTVLEALQDVDNSLISYVKEIDRRRALNSSVIAAKDSVKLVKVLYKSGLTDFQNVLDMERSLFEQQDSHAVSQGDVTKNLILIYKSLGGGWQIEKNSEENNIKAKHKTDKKVSLPQFERSQA